MVCVGVVGLYLLLRTVTYHDLHDRGVRAARECAETQPQPGDLPVRVAGYYLLQVTDSSGRVLDASPAMRGRPVMDQAAGFAPGATRTRNVEVPGVGPRVYVVTIGVQTPDGPRVAMAGVPLSPLVAAEPVLLGALAIATPVMLALVYWVVGRSVGRALGPVRVMGAELAGVTGGHLDRRVTVPPTHDEVSELAESVNVTLARLQRFVEAQRTFVADASHELRSPLTALRAQLEVALAAPEDEDWPAVARAALADADRLQRIVGDLLMLARLDAGVRGRHEEVDLGVLASAEVRHRNRKVLVQLTVPPPGEAVVLGDRSHLVRILTNLLDNAERHAESRIWLTVRREDDQAVAEVADDGAGIAPADRERIFQRFQRLAEGRSRDPGGTGLGLAIARDIAAAHGGTLVVAEPDSGEPDARKGARFVLRLPLKESGR